MLILLFETQRANHASEAQRSLAGKSLFNVV